MRSRFLTIPLLFMLPPAMTVAQAPKSAHAEIVNGQGTKIGSAKITSTANGVKISVTVAGFNSYRFIVSGNVNHPSALAQKWYVTVSEALMMAGGPSKFAGDEITIIRLDANGKAHRIPVSYKALISGKHPEQDICVVSGDTIVMD